MYAAINLAAGIESAVVSGTPGKQIYIRHMSLGNGGNAVFFKDGPNVLDGNGLVPTIGLAMSLYPSGILLTAGNDLRMISSGATGGSVIYDLV